MANDGIALRRKKDGMEKAPPRPPQEMIKSTQNPLGQERKNGKGLFLCGVGDTLKEAITACSRKGALDQPDVVRLEEHANLKDHHERLKIYFEDVEKDTGVIRESMSRNVHIEDMGDETDAGNVSDQNGIANGLSSETSASYNHPSNSYSVNGGSCGESTSTRFVSPPRQHENSLTKIMSGPSYSSDYDPGINPSNKQHKQDELYGTYKNYRVDDEFVTQVVDELAVTILPHFRSAASDDKHKYPIGVYSEPVAWNMHVRGKSYLYDKQKVRSAESLLAIIGADKFVAGKGANSEGDRYHLSKRKRSFFHRLKQSCEKNCMPCPFLLVINFVLPWGNFLMYMYRPDGDQSGPFNNSKGNEASEKSWRDFLTGSDEYKDAKFKLIPSLIAGPYLVKKMVGSKPAIIGQKLSTSYFGSIEENYVEICLDVTRGSKLANSISNSVCGHANQVTVDLGFTIESNDVRTLPEQLICAIRLHHISLKKNTISLNHWESSV